jgi:hypothetical protein
MLVRYAAVALRAGRPDLAIGAGRQSLEILCRENGPLAIDGAPLLATLTTATTLHGKLGGALPPIDPSELHVNRIAMTAADFSDAWPIVTRTCALASAEKSSDLARRGAARALLAHLLAASGRDPKRVLQLANAAAADFAGAPDVTSEDRATLAAWIAAHHAP